MREKILQVIEKNSRIDLKELAIILGYDEIDVANEVKKMEEEGLFELLPKKEDLPYGQYSINR